MVDDLQALFSYRTKLDVHKVQNHLTREYCTKPYFQVLGTSSKQGGQWQLWEAMCFFLILMFLSAYVCFTYTVSIFTEIQ